MANFECPVRSVRLSNVLIFSLVETNGMLINGKLLKSHMKIEHHNHNLTRFADDCFVNVWVLR